MKRALDAALADGMIRKDVYDLINRHGLETRSKGPSWEDGLVAAEPEPELGAIPEPEIAAPEPEAKGTPAPEIAATEPKAKGIPATEDVALELELEYISEMEKYEEAISDDYVPEQMEYASQAMAPEEVASQATGASIGSQAELSGEDKTPTLHVSGRIMEFFQCGTVKCVTTFCHFSKRGAFQKW